MILYILCWIVVTNVIVGENYLLVKIWGYFQIQGFSQLEYHWKDVAAMNILKMQIVENFFINFIGPSQIYSPILS